MLIICKELGKGDLSNVMHKSLTKRAEGRHADGLMKAGKHSKLNMFGIQALGENFA